MKKKIWLLLLTMLCLMAVPVFAETKVIQTDVTTASDGCVLLGIRGSYIADTDIAGIQDALDYINEIRLEACVEGYPDPRNSSRNLTRSDYVEIKWSSELEYIARIRAAESCMTYVEGIRTNGKSWSAISAPSGLKSSAENVSWNMAQSLYAGVYNWYLVEKDGWVNNRIGVQYRALINPNNLYVGMGSFYSTDGDYNTTVAEFSTASGLDGTRGESVPDCIQILEVSEKYLYGTYTIRGGNTGKIGDSITLYMNADSGLGNWNSSPHFLDMEKIIWTSSDPSVATVTSSGNGSAILTVKSCGETTIKAHDASGNTASMQFSLGHSIIQDKAVDPTCTETGLTAGSHCEICGKVIQAQTTIAALGHKAGDWVTVKWPTTTSEGQQERSCIRCDVNMGVQSIAKLKETQSTTENQKETGTQSTNTSGTQNTSGNSSTSGTTKATVKLNATSLPMKVKQTTTALKVVSKKTGDSIVSWKSSNTKVVTVSSSGKLTAKKKGTATVTVTMKSGAKASCKITVQTGTVKTTKLTVKPKSVTLKKGKSKTLTATRTPLTSGQKLQFKSSNKKVATVSSSGKITAKKKGTATITVTSGSKKVTVKVTVK